MSHSIIGKINRHPSIIHHNEIRDICRPLEKLNISYFSHVNIVNNEFSAITNNQGFHCHYLENEYYYADIHMAREGVIKDYCIWDLIDSNGKTAELNQAASEHHVRHTFTIFLKDETGDNYYHFGTHLKDSSINQVYLSSIEMLTLFISHFKHSVAESRQLSSAYQFKFNMQPELGEFSIINGADIDINAALRESFLNELVVDSHAIAPSMQTLTARQTTILYWLHQGKTVCDIARILGIADVTVNKHIAAIKSRAGCYTQFQLGEFFSSLASCRGMKNS